MGRFCSRFGGEGSGSHCERAVDLFKGREYSFHVEVSERNSSGTGWHASIIDEFSGNESEIGALFGKATLVCAAKECQVASCSQKSSVGNRSAR